MKWKGIVFIVKIKPNKDHARDESKTKNGMAFTCAADKARPDNTPLPPQLR